VKIQCREAAGRRFFSSGARSAFLASLIHDALSGQKGGGGKTRGLGTAPAFCAASSGLAVT